MEKLQRLLSRLAAKISFYYKKNEKISKADVGWHIEHVLLTLSLVTNAIAKSNPKGYKWTFNFIKIAVLTTGKIPRGRAASPEVVRPKGNYDMETLKNHLEKTKETLLSLHSLNDDQYFTHPYFGDLRLKPTIKFLEIHTRHHLAIINDILK